MMLRGLSFLSLLLAAILLAWAPKHVGSVEYEIPPICYLPVVIGQCPLTYGLGDVRFYFDSHTMQCLPFMYSRCGGNGNNFPSTQACQETCFSSRILKPGSGRIGALCETNADCGVGAWCVRRTCECMPDYVKVEATRDCYRKVNPGETGCYYNEQCMAHDNMSRCSGGICSCPRDTRPAGLPGNVFGCTKIQDGVPGSGLIGESCITAAHCQGGMWCNRGLCECTPDYAPHESRTCFRKMSEGRYGCVNHSQCAFLRPGSECENGWCVCPKNTRPVVQPGGGVLCYDPRAGPAGK